MELERCANPSHGSAPLSFGKGNLDLPNAAKTYSTFANCRLRSSGLHVVYVDLDLSWSWVEQRLHQPLDGCAQAAHNEWCCLEAKQHRHPKDSGATFQSWADAMS